jgi:hypothetical protein
MQLLLIGFPTGRKKAKSGDPFPDRRFDNSKSCAYLPTMKTQLVVPLPPIFSIANFFAPSTW